MFGYHNSGPKVRLTTDRLVVRLVHDRDAYRLADYYAENREFLKPWEPVRDESHCYPSGWQARLGLINELQKQGSAYYFCCLIPMRMKFEAWLILVTCCAALSMPAISAIHSVRNGRGKG